MPLNPKHFNRTVIIGGIIAALLLAITSLYIHLQSTLKFREYAQKTQKQIEHTWFHKVYNKDDSVRVSEYKGRVTAVLFWGTWADASKDMLKELRVLHNQYPDLVVLAASIRRIKPSVKDYLGDRTRELIYVDGTNAYSDFDVPGVPTMLVFDKNGKFVYAKVGYRNKSDIDRLRGLLAK